MKSLTMFSFAILSLTIGCDNAPAQNNGYGNHQMSQATPMQYQNNANNQNRAPQGGYDQSPQPQKGGDDEIVMCTVLNPQTGQPSSYIPVPASWKAIKGAKLGQPMTEGPNGLTITSFEPQTYMITNDQFTNQLYQQSGSQVMAPVGIEGVLNQQIIPQGRQMGMTFVNEYLLPSIAENESSYARKLSGSGPQDIYVVNGSDWTDNQGNKILVLLHYFEMRGSTIINWGYRVDMLKVQSSAFEKSKKQFIYALSNIAYNQDEVNNFNAQLAAQMQQQKANNDNFNAIMEINRKGAAERAEMNRQTTEYISNSNKASYEYRTHVNDVVQEQENNYLSNQNVVVSPYDGKEYQVESGAETYWINDKGVYFKSNDPLFDPNKYETHPGVWQKAPLKEYK